MTLPQALTITSTVLVVVVLAQLCLVFTRISAAEESPRVVICCYSQSRKRGRIVLIAWPDSKMWRGQLVAIGGHLILGYVLTQAPR